jgi:hypothetical protein
MTMMAVASAPFKFPRSLAWPAGRGLGGLTPAGPAAAALPVGGAILRVHGSAVASAAAADGRKAHSGSQWPGIEMGGSHHRPSVPGPGSFALFSSQQPEIFLGLFRVPCPVQTCRRTRSLNSNPHPRLSLISQRPFSKVSRLGLRVCELRGDAGSLCVPVYHDGEL